MHVLFSISVHMLNNKIFPEKKNLKILCFKYIVTNYLWCVVCNICVKTTSSFFFLPRGWLCRGNSGHSGTTLQKGYFRDGNECSFCHTTLAPSFSVQSSGWVSSFCAHLFGNYTAEHILCTEHIIAILISQSSKSMVVFSPVASMQQWEDMVLESGFLCPNPGSAL